MGNKKLAMQLIKDKIENKTFLEYKEIAMITGYHPKYLLKMKKDLLNGTLKLEHGNKNRVPVNIMSEEEKQYIISLYKKSNASIRAFCKFYNRRSYSCIYNVLKNAGLVGVNQK